MTNNKDAFSGTPTADLIKEHCRVVRLIGQSHAAASDHVVLGHHLETLHDHADLLARVVKARVAFEEAKAMIFVETLQENAAQLARAEKEPEEEAQEEGTIILTYARDDGESGTWRYSASYIDAARKKALELVGPSPKLDPCWRRAEGQGVALYVHGAPLEDIFPCSTQDTITLTYDRNNGGQVETYRFSAVVPEGLTAARRKARSLLGLFPKLSADGGAATLERGDYLYVDGPVTLEDLFPGITNDYGCRVTSGLYQP